MSDDISTSDVSAPSSDATETQAPPPPAPDSTPAPSSSASDDKSPSSGDSRQSDHDGLLAVVQRVVDVKPETDLPSDDAESGDPALSTDQAAAPGTEGTPPEAPTEIPDPSEAELKKLRPETRRRFERLLAQRNEARQQVQEWGPEIQQHRQ